jgi:hypothetical protein
MSASRKPTNKSSTAKPVVINKHCAFCFNAGEPESAYTSHFLRESKDSHSKVVCPLLLNNECPCCGKKGHTRKECKIKYNKKVTQEPVAKATNNKVTKAAHKSINCFDALMSSDSEDEREKKIAPITTKTKFAPTSTFNPSTATKLSAYIFPSLPKSVAVAAQSQPKLAAQKCQVISSLQQLYPNLTVPTTTPRVPTTKPPMAKIVRPFASKIYPHPQCDAEYAVEADDESDTEITAIYNTALAEFNSRPKYSASTADWAALEDPSSDEEDW